MNLPQNRKPIKPSYRVVTAEELQYRIVNLFDNNPFALLPQVRNNFVVEHGIDETFFEKCLEELVRIGALEVELKCFFDENGAEEWDDYFSPNWNNFNNREVTTQC